MHSCTLSEIQAGIKYRYKAWTIFLKEEIYDNLITPNIIDS